MNNSTIAWKTRARPSAVSLRSAVLDDFMVKMLHGFPKPQNKFIRVMSYASWRNMSAIVLATTYFTAAWLGRGVRKDVLVAHIEHMHQRFNEVPEFFLYALAAGIKRAFVRYGKTLRVWYAEQNSAELNGGRKPLL